MVYGGNVKKSDIDFGETNTDVRITNENVKLNYTKKDPEYGTIRISRHNLPDIRISHKDWESLFQVLSDFNAFIAWTKAKEEMDGE